MSADTCQLTAALLNVLAQPSTWQDCVNYELLQWSGQLLFGMFEYMFGLLRTFQPAKWLGSMSTCNLASKECEAMMQCHAERQKRIV